jgi:hypothetical protein
MAAAAALLLAGASCGVTAKRQADFVEPYLTEDLLVRFVESLREPESPLESVLQEAAANDEKLTLAALQPEIWRADLETFARRHGFSDYDQFLAVWRRAAVGRLQLHNQQDLEILNAADLELVRKFEGRIEEAMSRFVRREPARPPQAS